MSMEFTESAAMLGNLGDKCEETGFLLRERTGAPSDLQAETFSFGLQTVMKGQNISSKY